LSYAGTFTMQNNATLDLAGVDLSLSATTFLQNSTLLDGSGVLVTLHGSTTNVNAFTFGGSDIWENSGVVGEVGTLQLGDSTSNAATSINKKGGGYQFKNDSGIAIGLEFGSSFQNLRTLEKIGGTGTSFIDVNFTNTGRIVVATVGTIELTAAPRTALPARSRGPGSSFSAPAARTRSPAGRRFRRGRLRSPITTLWSRSTGI
jgi:hypothetical protein